MLNHTSYEGYQITICEQLDNPEWDAFVARFPGGYYMQTSSWAHVKTFLSWKGTRIIVYKNNQIVGGMQLLYRTLSFGITIGFVPRGPMMVSDDLIVTDIIFQQLRTLFETYHTHYITIQPPPKTPGTLETMETFSRILRAYGFQDSSCYYLPTATIVIDLTADGDTLMANMRKKNRQHIRASARNGWISVRQGNRDDITTFYRLLLANSQRRQFKVHDSDYFLHMWDTLDCHNMIKVFVAECDNAPVSALLVLPFGDTVHYKYLGWSGQHGNRWPNEVLHWESIKWAKENGYRQCDLEGIEPDACHALLQGKEIPDECKYSPTSFKLGFGGQAIETPGPLDFFPNPVLQWGYSKIFPRIAHWPLIEKVVERVQTG
jgi:lipid II:glycine glycyltransferase (peptidoglycan interpeptide bridge formation enzyme)